MPVELCDIPANRPPGPARPGAGAIWLAAAIAVVVAGLGVLGSRTDLAIDALVRTLPDTPDAGPFRDGIAGLQEMSRTLLFSVIAAAGLMFAAWVTTFLLMRRNVHRIRAANDALALLDRQPQLPAIAAPDGIRDIVRAVAAIRGDGEALAGREHALNARFAAAIDNLAQGLVILDPELRLVVNNRRLYDFYALSGAPFTPGTPLSDIIARNVAEGHHPGHSADELYQSMATRLAAGLPFEYRHEFPGGRIVAAQWHKLPDGGWVGTFQDITEQHRSVVQIEHMARHDGLTDLLNRAGFEEAVGRAIARSRRGEDFAVLAVCLHRFKPVNDTFGYATGDALLREAARRMQRSVREVDAVARLGGDEFAIVQSGIDQPIGADALAQRLADIVSLPYQIDGNEIVIGASIGIALGGRGTGDADEALRNATLALHRAKAESGRQAGRAIHRFFEPEMDERAKARRALEADLRQALNKNEFELFYQPLVNVGERRVCAFEALIRWRHPTRGLVPPDAFIPLAEEIGLIVPIGEWVLHTACTEAMLWEQPDGGPDLRVAVNLSAVQFSSPGLVAAVSDALKASGLPGSRLELEITESVLLQENDATLDTLHRLRDLGARISMDDFGTGYSSLSYLRSFPFDKIKIDKSFIRGLSDSDESNAIVRAIAGLGITLGIATTAEGVETLEQLEKIVADGCTEVQGYFFSPPRPAAEVPSLILNTRADAAA